MAKVNRKARVALDRYDTPPHYTRAMLDAIEPQGTALEPCVGGRNIADMLVDCGMYVITNDIEKAVEADYHLDARGIELYADLPEVDWIITNPPFSWAYQILRRCLEARPRMGVIMLLGVNFQEPIGDRAWLLRKHRPDYSLNLPRYSFDGSGVAMHHLSWLAWYTAGDPYGWATLPKGIDFYDGPKDNGRSVKAPGHVAEGPRAIPFPLEVPR